MQPATACNSLRASAKDKMKAGRLSRVCVHAFSPRREGVQFRETVGDCLRSHMEQGPVPVLRLNVAVPTGAR
jgi:hypothetical protein